MPKYEVVRSYTVSQVAKLEAENANQARIIAMNWDGHWKEYEGDYKKEMSPKAQNFFETLTRVRKKDYFERFPHIIESLGPYYYEPKRR